MAEPTNSQHGPLWRRENVRRNPRQVGEGLALLERAFARKFSSIYLYGKVIFKKPETIKKLDEMANSIELYERTKNLLELETAYNRIADDLSQVIPLFASELNEK